MRMRRVVALVSGFGWHVEDLSRASKEFGVEFLPIPFPRISGRFGNVGPTIAADGLDLSNVDGILVRMMPPGSLEQVVFRMDALHRLESLGVRLMNPPRAVETAVDKYLTLARLEASGLPVPPTWAGESPDEAMVVFEQFEADVVVKPLFGSEGKGLVRVTDREVAWRTFQTLSRLGLVLYVQRYISHPGFDYRVFVLGDRVLGAIKRTARPGDWRTNIAVGGTAEPIEITPTLECLSLNAARSVGAIMAGVDLIPDPSRNAFSILEVNAVPGWRALASATGIDVASAILTELLDARR